MLNLFFKVTLLTFIDLRILTMVLSSEILIARLYAFKFQGSMPDLML